jgi:hypothetical protein
MLDGATRHVLRLYPAWMWQLVVTRGGSPILAGEITNEFLRRDRTIRRITGR